MWSGIDFATEYPPFELSVYSAFPSLSSVTHEPTEHELVSKLKQAQRQYANRKVPTG